MRWNRFKFDAGDARKEAKALATYLSEHPGASGMPKARNVTIDPRIGRTDVIVDGELIASLSDDGGVSILSIERGHSCAYQLGGYITTTGNLVQLHLLRI